MIKHRFPIIQVVGYKDSGKTTLMEKLISYFSRMKKRVGTLKHHGHGGEPAIVKGTDSYKHLKAGSVMSAVQGEKRVQMTLNDHSPLSLNELVHIYSLQPIDILLIEGYKHANYPKIVLIKTEADLELLEKVSNITAVGLWDSELHKQIPNYYTFPLHHIDKNLPQLLQYIKVNID